MSDVDILRQCCLLFRGFFMVITNIPISKLESLETEGEGGEVDSD